MTPDLLLSVVEHLATADSGGGAQPAYLVSDPQGHVAAWGGNLERYGISGVASGADIADVFPVVHGLLPLEGQRHHLPQVEIHDGINASVYLTPTPSGDVVLILDTTEQAHAARDRQQEVHEQALATATSESLFGPFADVVPNLGLVVLDHRRDDVFQVLSAPPPWLTSLWPDWAQGAVVGIGEFSPFLENFLYDAEETWNTRSQRPVRSGVWTEVSADDTSFVLEATAIHSAGRNLMLVQTMGDAYSERWTTLQAARDSALQYRNLLREIERKDVLLHCIVHDLRGPMASVFSSLELMSEDPAHPNLQDLLLGSMVQLERQDLFIRSILDVFKHDAGGELADRQQSTDAHEAVQVVLASFDPVATVRRVNFTGPKATDEPLMVIGEHQRLVRVLSNMVDNALRQLRSGGNVCVGIEPAAHEVRFTVDDDGRGIPVDQMDRIFDRFAQGKGTSGSSGLGLHFCRITVEGWGGAIGCENRKTGGARFWFTLPTPDHESETPVP